MPVFLIFEQLVNGLILGSMYALIAIALSLIWGTMRMLNFAQGEFYMLGGYGAYFLIQTVGLSPWIGIPLAILAVAIASAVIQTAIIQPFMGSKNWEFSTIVATLGISIILQNFALHVFGERFQAMDYFVDAVFSIGDVRIVGQRLLIFGASLAGAAFLWVLLKRTSFGLALRATAQDGEAATLYGVNTRLIYLGTFVLAAMLSALAAVMLAPIQSVNPWMGAPVMLKGFVVVVLGGLGRIEGAILGGLILGVTETLTTMVFSSQWQDVAGFVLLIVTIWIRPWGLLGVREH